jgi:hypothetical protein
LLGELGGLLARRLADQPVVVPVVRQLIAAYSAQLDYLNRDAR